MRRKMTRSPKMNWQLVVAFVLAIVCLTQSINAEQSTKDIEEQQLGSRPNEVKYSLLRRILNYDFPRLATLSGTGSGGPAPSYKRSSSALDALTGVTLGKRSAPALGLVNYEPVFATMRPGPRMYDMRWYPFEALENQQQIQQDNN